MLVYSFGVWPTTSGSLVSIDTVVFSFGDQNCTDGLPGLPFRISSEPPRGAALLVLVDDRFGRRPRYGSWRARAPWRTSVRPARNALRWQSGPPWSQDLPCHMCERIEAEAEALICE